MINDPIADMLTRIRNSILRGQREVSIPASKVLVQIARILEEEGFINGHEVKREENKNQDSIIVSLKYVNGQSAIFNLERVSKPGLRKYSGYKDLEQVKKGIGISIVSTSKGIMTADKAKTEKVGGEVLAKIW